MNSLCCQQRGHESEVVRSSQPALDEIDRVNRNAYDLLASEYDDPAHATTRALEDLSDRLLLKHLPKAESTGLTMLEIGCGTGRLTEKLIGGRLAPVSYCGVDISPKMCELARARLVDRGLSRNAQFRCASVFQEDLGTAEQFNFIVAGLADPYLILPALKNIRRVCRKGASFVFSLPESQWALRERTRRLGVPANLTRFRLRTGEEIFPYSFTYSIRQLAELLASAKMDLRVTELATAAPGVFDSANPPAVILGIAV